jgi:hypothetical protein
MIAIVRFFSLARVKIVKKEHQVHTSNPFVTLLETEFYFSQVPLQVFEIGDGQNDTSHLWVN